MQAQRYSRIVIMLLAALIVAASGSRAYASTYAVYIPLDSPIYDELDALNGLGYLDTYLDEIKPISRVEAARLVLEGDDNLAQSEHSDPLAREMLDALKSELSEEIGWIENLAEDRLPTMIHPVQRMEAEYIYSRGDSRIWQTGDPKAGLHATEDTPLLPNNDGIPTASGSNEVVRYSGWAGLGGMMSLYGEAAVAGPLTRTVQGSSRLRPLGSAAVLSLGNTAVSFGAEEMRWGVGHFGSLSQGDNADPFPALRVQNIHPTLLPGFLRYLGQFRYQMFLGQLDGDRYFSHPWIDGQIFSFKPTPNFELGITHAIMFGGAHNANYSMLGFVGRATGLATGSAIGANTNSRAGVYLKFRFPSLRDLEVYQELLGEDNLTREARPIGGALPFLAVSYQGGLYLPRLTEDGRTDLRFEYALTEPNYSLHGDSLYWEYNGLLMGYPLGPDASKVDVSVGRWLRGIGKAGSDFFYVERAPWFGTHQAYPASVYGSVLSKERGFGVGFSLLGLPTHHSSPLDNLSYYRAQVYMEFLNHMNFGGTGNFRTVVSLKVGLTPTWKSFKWE